MTGPKYFVIRCIYNDEGESGIVVSVHARLADARAQAEQCAVAYPETRYLIATETQSVIGRTQVNWTDK